MISSLLLFSFIFFTAQANRICNNGTWLAPQPGTTWQWQLQGTIDTDIDVNVYDIDMFNNDPAAINDLQNMGRAVICYIDTAYEPYRPDSSSFPDDILGNDLDGFPGQKWVDIRSPILRGIMLKRLQLAYAKGCDGIEWDDVDAFENDPGFPLTFTDQLEFNMWLANMTHSYSMAAALKNDLDQAFFLVDYFDFAINEQCYQYQECDLLLPFTNQSKAVFGVEYVGNSDKYCPVLNSLDFSWLAKDLNLDADVTECCAFDGGSCSGQPFICTSYTDSLNVTLPVEPESSSSDSNEGSRQAASLSLMSALVLFWCTVMCAL